MMEKEINKCRIKLLAKKIPLSMAVGIAVVTFLAGYILAITLSGSISNIPAFRNTDTQDMDGRIRVLEAEIEKHPLDVKLWTELADLYSDFERIDQAISAYEKVVSINPVDANAWTQIGILYHRNGKPDNAIEALDRAIAVDLKHEDSRFIKGFVLMNDLKNRDAAIKAWEELLDINPLAMVSSDQSLDQLIQHYRDHQNKN